MASLSFQFFYLKVNIVVATLCLHRIPELPSNPLFPIEDELFQNFTMHPKDMDFEAIEIDNETWTNLLNITSSHVNIPPVGRNVKLAVRETNTGK